MVTKEQIDSIALTMRQDWAVLSAGESGHYNAMTIGWAYFGCLWNIPSAMVFVRESRYTLEFLEKYDRFAISFYPPEYHKALITMGHKSGRNVDKAAITGFVPKFVEGSVTFEQACLTVICRKMYSQWMDMSAFPSAVVDRFYSKGNVHKMFAGQIVSIL